jgi:HlyD family secretion protein
MKHRNLWIGLGVLVVLVGGYSAYLVWRPGPEVAAIKVELGNIRSYVEERARTSLPHTTRLTMPFDGRIEPITLVPGTKVAAGEAVARVETDDLKDELSAAIAEVAQIDAQLAVLEDNRLETTALQEFQGWIEAMANVEASATELISANQAHARFSDWWAQAEEKLKTQGAVAEEKYRRVQTESSEADVELAVAKLNHQLVKVLQQIVALGPKYVQDYLGRKSLQAVVLESQRKVAEAQLALVERQLARAEIKAPAPGVVLERLVESRRELAAGTVLLTLGDPSSLRVTADLLSSDAGRVVAGDAVEIYGPALGGLVLNGSVKRVDPQGFTKVSSLGVDQQRVAVIIELADGERARLAKAGGHLGVAYRVHVRVYTDQADQALAVPRIALMRDRASGSGWSLYRVVKGRAVLTPVELGIGNPEQVQVTKGIEAGDVVLGSPPNSLVAGSKVTPKLSKG